MKTEAPTPLTDLAEGRWHEHHAEYAVRDLCRKLEQASLSNAEALLVDDLIKLWHAAWDCGRCRRDCQCSRCLAMEKAGDHDKTTFNSLSEKVSKRILT